MLRRVYETAAKREQFKMKKEKAGDCNKKEVETGKRKAVECGKKSVKKGGKTKSQSKTTKQREATTQLNPVSHQGQTSDVG
jgi:hypothetical protein